MWGKVGFKTYGKAFYCQKVGNFYELFTYGEVKTQLTPGYKRAIDYLA